MVRVGVPFDEPQQFFCNATPEHSLRGQQREAAVPQIKPHLGPEHREGAGPSAIPLLVARLNDAADQIQILCLFLILLHILAKAVPHALLLLHLRLRFHTERRLGGFEGVREKCVRVAVGLDPGYVHVVAQAPIPLEALAVQLPTPDHEHFVNDGQIGARVQGRLQRRRDVHPITGFSHRFANDNVHTVWQRPELFWDGLPCLAAHDYGVSLVPVLFGDGRRDVFEILHLVGQAPWNATGFADPQLRINSNDQTERPHG
mmetsp:Transcript_3562/g.6823  ORF Transcript_3562/g.6823 Transcript_3562/m.6823 type:complete len:259 (-) Transcript_3562:153-929(-)